MMKAQSHREELRPAGLGVNYAAVLTEDQAAAARAAIAAERDYFDLVKEAQATE